MDEEIRFLIGKIWKFNKQGYCWIVSKHGDMRFMTREQKVGVVKCLESKRAYTECPVHRRVHGV